MLDDKYLDSLVKQAAEFGNGKIHIIVNNAGYTWDGVIHKVSNTSSRRSPLTKRRRRRAPLSSAKETHHRSQKANLPLPDNRQTMGHNPRPA